MEQGQLQVLGDSRKDSGYVSNQFSFIFFGLSTSILIFVTLTGIVGYGHIGSQLSVLAEAMGMNVIYYDVVTLMALGTARQVPTLENLLEDSDFVSLHVPDLPETRNMMSTPQFERMKTGAYLINASRGSVVDIPAMIKASRAGKVAGAALDVYPNEPAANGDYFTNDLNTWGEDLRSLKNLILTPHIGGSTEEAQRAIGVEGTCLDELCMIYSKLTSSLSCRCLGAIHQPGYYSGQCQFA